MQTPRSRHTGQIDKTSLTRAPESDPDRSNYSSIAWANSEVEISPVRRAYLPLHEQQEQIHERQRAKDPPGRILKTAMINVERSFTENLKELEADESMLRTYSVSKADAR